ncbi:LAMI_0B06810g1_1 [Lachancea mirantina]|uniref:LAMI_0B06810g1_1 n=1 Tax=Lachancea mirantina TaxID=1230905 RepID=A0A1G4IX85_9SACH|nr:LAMI_0B06810g1_1 [Lachancea mirantina]
MPLLSVKHYNTVSEPDILKINPDEIAHFSGQSMRVRDDTELTSSDEEEVELLDGEITRSGKRSWFQQESRPHTASSNPKASTRSNEQGTRPKSSSPFKRSLSALFKKGEDLDSDFVVDDPTSVAPRESNASKCASDITIDNNVHSSRFWRSWKMRHHQHHEKPSLNATAPLDNQEEIENGRKNDIKAATPSDSVRGSNKARLMELEIDDDLMHFDRLAAGNRAKSTEDESNERNDDKEAEDLLCEKSVKMSSPLTPVDDEASWVNSKKAFDFGSYENIYQTSKAYMTESFEFDSLPLQKNSRTYVNFLSIIQLLDGAPSEILNKASLLDFSGSLLQVLQKTLLSVGGPQNGVTQDKVVESNVKNELYLMEEKYEQAKQELCNARLDINRLEQEMDETQVLLKRNRSHALSLEQVLEKERESWTALEIGYKRNIDQKITEIKVLNEKQTQLIAGHAMEKDNLQSMLNEYKQELKNSHQTHEKLVDEYELQTKEFRIITSRSTTLQESCQQQQQLAEKATQANLTLQKDFQRERNKVLDLRRDNRLLKKQTDLLTAHKTNALQFMAQIMMSYKNVIDNQTMKEYDEYLEWLNKDQFSDISILKTKRELSDAELSKQLQQQRDKVAKFYHDFAKIKVLDQVFSKHVSYMRSNSFLSQQLKGLRKQIQDNEDYIKRLLKDCKTQRTLISKQHSRLLNKTSPDSASANDNNSKIILKP